MSVIPKIYNFNEHYNGSTFSAIKIKFNFSILNAEVIVKIRNVATLEVVFEWSIGKNITVVDIATGDIVLNQINAFSLAEGKYIYDLKIVFINGDSQTYIKGEVPIQF